MATPSASIVGGFDAEQPWQDFVHTGPGTLAGRYLRRFWQPVCISQDLPPGRAQPIKVLGEELTLYRGEPGAAHLVAFRCAHRGTQLATGWVEGDEIRCFYHGWKYDGSGQCTEQPAEPEPFCQRIRIRSYPVQEYLGLVFAYLGDGEPPELPRYPDIETAPEIVVDTYVRTCNYFNGLENSHDPVHVSFVHRTLTADALTVVPQLITAEETDWGVRVGATRPNGQERVNQFGMPNRVWRAGTSGDMSGQDAFAWRVPVDDVSYRSFNLTIFKNRPRDSSGPRLVVRSNKERDAEVRELTLRVLRGELTLAELADHPGLFYMQDSVAQVGQGLIPDRDQDRLGRADAAVTMIRAVWQRELRALAEGRPLKQWVRAEDLSPAAGG